MIVNFQYLWTCIVFNTSKPYRLPIYTNYLFFAAVLTVFAFDTAIVFSPNNSSIPVAFDMMPMEIPVTEGELKINPQAQPQTFEDFRAWIYIGIFVDLACTFVGEAVIANFILPWFDKKGVERKNRDIAQLMLQLEHPDKQVPKTKCC